MIGSDQMVRVEQTEGLPEGWAPAQIGDVIMDVQPGFACGVNNRGGHGVAHMRPMNVSEDGRIRLADIKYVPEEEVDGDRRRLRYGDVLFNNTNSPELVGKTAFYDLTESFAFSNHMTRLRCNPDAIDPRFCSKLLHQKWHEGYFLSVCNNHVSQASVGSSVLLETPIWLPPLAEQKRIVAKLEELLGRVNAARERLDRVLRIMKRFRRAVLAAACSGRLTEGWRERHPQVEPAVVTIERMRASTTETPWYEPVFEHRRKSEIPSSWSFVALGSLGSWYSGGTPSTSVSTFWTGGTVPWVTPKDMKTAIIMDSKDHITEDAVSKTRLHVLQPGSVMFVVRGLILARSFPVALAGRPTTINQDIRAIEARGGMSADYLLRALWAEEGEILHAVRDSTHGTKRLESDTLKSWPIPMPPPPEQDEIVRRVEALFALADAIEKHVAAAKLRADKLTQSILAKAFRGELVPTEAELARREGRSYEPASVLLGRIRAEREKGKPRTARSRKRGSAGPSVSSR